MEGWRERVRMEAGRKGKAALGRGGVLHRKRVGLSEGIWKGWI